MNLQLSVFPAPDSPEMMQHCGRLSASMSWQIWLATAKMCGGRGTGSFWDSEYLFETCICTEDESLSVDVYILLTEKGIIEILATSAEKVVPGVVGGVT